MESEEAGPPHLSKGSVFETFVITGSGKTDTSAVLPLQRAMKDINPSTNLFLSLFSYSEN